MMECNEEPWEHSEQLYLLELLVDEVTVDKDAAYGSDSNMLSLSAKVQFLDFPEMEVEPNELVVAHRQRGNEATTPKSEIPGFPGHWEVSLAADLPDFHRFPQYRVKIPVKNPKPLKSYIITVLVPQIAVTAGEALRYTYTALEKNTDPEVMDAIKSQVLEKLEQDRKKGDDEPLFPIKFASAFDPSEVSEEFINGVLFLFTHTTMGKSCIFRLSPDDLIKGLKKYPLYVLLYTNGIVDSVPVNLLVGKVRIILGEPFIRAILLVENSTVLPVSTHIEEMFQMEDIFGNKSGTVGLFVRLSCFGCSINPPLGQDIMKQPKSEKKEEEAPPTIVGQGPSGRKKPQALLADEDLTPKISKDICQEKLEKSITWRRAGDKMPEIPKPKLATLPPIHMPLPPPPPREIPPFDLAEHLPGLPRCTPLTPPPCYRRAGDPPLSRCEKEMEKQLQREDLTKGIQTESYEPVQRLPPQSPYIDRTVKVDGRYDQYSPIKESALANKQENQITTAQQFGNSPPGKQEACECPTSAPSATGGKQENNPTKSKADNSNASIDQSPDKSKQNVKAVSSDESSTKKKQDPTGASEAGLIKEGTDLKAKDVESSLKPKKKCTCQDLTPEQKKMKQKPPPCTCKRKGTRHKKDKKLNDDDTKTKRKDRKKECPECERIRLNGNLMRALQKITALEAQHDLTDSKVDAILKEEYGKKGELIDYTETTKKQIPLQVEGNIKTNGEVREITADEREKELREKFKDIIESEVSKFEEKRKQTKGTSRGETAVEKHLPPKNNKPADKEKKQKKKRKSRKKADSNLEEILKWMYPGHNYGHKFCLRPLRLVPKTMGWLWNISPASGLMKPGLGWRPGAMRTEVHQAIKEWKKSRGGDFVEEDEDMLVWGVRHKRRPATPKSPGSKKAESIKYNPTLHMHKKNGFYYISMYPIRSSSMDELGLDPKPAMFKINAKRPEGSEASEITDSTSDEESYDIEFITPSAMQKQIKKPPKSNASAQYLEEDFMPKIKKKKLEPELETKKPPSVLKKKTEKKGKGKGKKK